MMEKIRKIWNRNLIRPWIYMTAARGGMGLLFALLMERFIGDGCRNLSTYAFLFLTLFFVALAWIAWLRLDGVQLPKLMMKRWNFKNKPKHTFGDMSDYTDEPIVSFEDLEDPEKDVCCLLSDSVCAVLFLILCVLGI